jgi:hypothetical protein
MYYSYYCPHYLGVAEDSPILAMYKFFKKTYLSEWASPLLHLQRAYSLVFSLPRWRGRLFSSWDVNSQMQTNSLSPSFRLGMVTISTKLLGNCPEKKKKANIFNIEFSFNTEISFSVHMEKTFF